MHSVAVAVSQVVHWSTCLWMLIGNLEENSWVTQLYESEVGDGAGDGGDGSVRRWLAASKGSNKAGDEGSNKKSKVEIVGLYFMVRRLAAP